MSGVLMRLILILISSLTFGQSTIQYFEVATAQSVIAFQPVMFVNGTSTVKTQIGSSMALGVAAQSASSGSVAVYTYGLAPCRFNSLPILGNIVIASGGFCTDSGSIGRATILNTLSSIGKAISSASTLCATCVNIQLFYPESRGSMTSSSNIYGTIMTSATVNGDGTVTYNFSNGTSTTSSASLQGPAGPSVINIQTFNLSGTWTKPSVCNYITVQIASGGGGGGGGRSDPGATILHGGGGGGGGGAYAEIQIPCSSLAATVPVTVGVGGPGAVAVTGTSNGSVGTLGGISSFGTFIATPPATAGGGGTGAGGGTAGTATGAVAYNSATGTASGVGGSATVGGAGATSTVISGGTGGGGGGGIVTGGTLSNAGIGGARTAQVSQAGAAVNTNGTSPLLNVGNYGGNGGGGGVASLAAIGTNGGAGSAPGGGGGGGGAGVTGGGRGGAGAPGRVTVISQ